MATSIRVEWALPCDYALIDAGGKLSLMGIFERLFAGNFPAVHPLMYIVVQWAGPPFGTIDGELRIWGPSKDLIGTAQQHIQLGETGRGASLLRIAPIPLPAPGEYVFEILGGGVSQCHVPVIVEQTPVQ